MSNRTLRSKSKIFILALVLLLPGFLYLAVNRFGSNEYISLPVFGEKKLSGEMIRNRGREYPDTIFHSLSSIKVEDFNGNEVVFPAQDTSVTIAHLFYTKDKAFSRLMLDYVQRLATRFAEIPMIKFYSISVDPEETKDALLSFIVPYKNIGDKYWNVVYKPSVDIFKYAEEEMLIDAMVDPTDSTRFLISNQLVLLDSKQRIRGFYDITVKSEVDRLEDEVKLLAVEEVRNKKIKIEKK